jgi:dipeptidyl aminopeptidase/acylaminoacyl peptidase
VTITNRKLITISFALCFGLVCSSKVTVAAADKRPLTADDLSRIEEFDERSPGGAVAFSPDGQSFVYVLQRGKNTTDEFAMPYVWGSDRGDVWLAEVVSGKSRKIADGSNDHCGFWAPKWSPDGQSIAMISNRAGALHVWIWSKQSGQLRMLLDRGTGGVVADDLQWVSNHELAFAVLPEGKIASYVDADLRTPEIAAREWAKTRKGRETTASVLESGTPGSMEGRPLGQLLLVDITTGSQRVLENGADFSTPRLSPDGRYLAFLKQTSVWRPDPKQLPAKHLIERVYQVEVTSLREGFQTRLLTGIGEAFMSSIVWSPDSSALAVVGYLAPASSEQERIFRCDIAEGAGHPITDRNLELDLGFRNGGGSNLLLWRGGHDLLVTAREVNGASPKWWAVDREGHTTEFFGGSAKPVSGIMGEAGRDSLIGIVDGALWRVDASGRAVQNLTPGLGKKIGSIAWPRHGVAVGGGLIFTVRQGSTTELYQLDLASGRVSPIEKPSPVARLVGFSETGGASVFLSQVETGTYLWLKRSGDPAFATVVQTNTFLTDVYENGLRKIEYRGLDGQNLKAWYILPFGYQDGKRYPVVTWVYAGQEFGDEPPQGLTRINESHPLNLQMLAAHGYVVLMPSMPLKPYGSLEDPYMELTKGVLPAIDKLVEAGVADLDRVGVIGQSYGGYSTYGLITQTNRFRAAVALAGLSNLISLYGVFDARDRYQSTVHENPFRIWDAETLAMGSPPWIDLGRYLRNSPLTYVDRVQTPILMIQGDLDYIPIQQGEEFFTALYRQNKRARFVRYFGEDHILSSPANIRDMWNQVYAWFDEYLAPADKSAEKPAQAGGH